MATTTMLNLPAVTGLAGDESVWVVQGGTDKRATVSALFTAGAVIFATKADAELFDPVLVPDFIGLAGYYTAGDSPLVIYKKVLVEPTHAGKLQTADGTWYELTGDNVSIASFGAKGDESNDDTTAIQNCVDYLQAPVLPGGTILVPANFACKITSTILVTKPNIRFSGEGSNQAHDAGASASDGTSYFIWYGAAGSTMVKFATPYSATSSVVADVGFSGIQMDGRNLASVGLLVDTIRRGVFRALYIASTTTAAYKVTCGVSGVDTAPGEAADTQHCLFDRCTFRQVDNIAVKSAAGFWLTGSTNANTSSNQFMQCLGQHWDGAGFLLENCDNNELLLCSASRNGGSGYSFDFWGAQASPASGGAVGNTLYNPSWPNTNGCILRGTNDIRFSAAATSNVFIEIDSANGALLPTAGTGATFSASRLNGELYRAGPILSSGGTPALGGVGYTTGAGNSASQTVSKAADVTISAPTGRIIMNNANLAAGATVGFLVNNSCSQAVDTVSINTSDAAGSFTVLAYQVWVSVVSANSFRIAVKNISGGDLAEAVCLQFNVHKGAVS